MRELYLPDGRTAVRISDHDLDELIHIGFVEKWGRSKRSRRIAFKLIRGFEDIAEVARRSKSGFVMGMNGRPFDLAKIPAICSTFSLTKSGSERHTRTRYRSMKLQGRSAKKSGGVR